MIVSSLEETKMLRSVKAGWAVAAVLAAAACATTSFQGTWKAPDVGPLNLNGVKVAALVMSGDRGFRLPAETTLAEQITAQGAVGVAAHTLLADELTREENQDKARAELEKAGVKGVVVMRVVDNQQRITSTPSTFWMGPPYAAFWGRPGWGRPGYWGWGWGWGHMHAPTVRTDTVVSVETLIFSMPEDRLVWVGTSQTTNPSNVNNFVRELSGVAARELRRAGLLQ